MATQSTSDLIALLRSARDAIDAYLQQASPPSAPAQSSKAATDQNAGTKGAARPQPLGGAQFDDVRAHFIKQVVERTGYPEEMLELDLDLEGELGIDTVKQVAVLAAVREHYGLDVDPAFKLRDHNTLRKAITFIAGRLQRESGKSAS